MAMSVLPSALGRRARVEELATVPEDVAGDYLGVYRAAFAPLEAAAPARQSLTDEEFLEEMTDPTVVKFVLRDRSGQVVALATMATDLSSVPWISVPYYTSRYPEHAREGRIFYFLCLLVHPDRRRGPWGALLLRHLGRYLADRGAIAAFDCCGHNVGGSVDLPELILRAQQGVVRVDAAALDQQRYYAYAYSHEAACPSGEAT
jgi:hypothetical protein